MQRKGIPKKVVLPRSSNHRIVVRIREKSKRRERDWKEKRTNSLPHTHDSMTQLMFQCRIMATKGVSQRQHAQRLSHATCGYRALFLFLFYLLLLLLVLSALMSVRNFGRTGIERKRVCYDSEYFCICTIKRCTHSDSWRWHHVGILHECLKREKKRELESIASGCLAARLWNAFRLVHSMLPIWKSFACVFAHFCHGNHFKRFTQNHVNC